MNDLILKKHDKNYFKSVISMINTTREVLKFKNNLNEGCSSMSSEHLAMLIDFINILEIDKLDLYNKIKKLKEDNLLIKSANKLVSDNLHNYKSRIDKAIEILKAMKHADKFLEGYSRISNIDNLLNILQGSDEK